MATTTNFGWETPDDTDLVKDGAAAMRTLGNAIDTSLVDLKGGTTGQILSKASNTDMDFTWVASNPGDITEVTAGAGLSGGGTSGAVTLNLNTLTAGKNAVINGGFDIWQRGTSSTSSGYQTADRWYQGLYTGTGTFSQDSSTIPSGSRYSLKFTASATAQAYIQQAIETMNTLAFVNQTVTLSAEVACSSSQSFNLKLQYSTSVDNSITGSWTDCTLVSASATVTSTSTLARKSVIYTIPSTAKSLRVVIELTNTIANTATANIGNVQLELGSSATPFSRAGGTIQGELAACQRYYYRFTPTATTRFGMGYVNSTTKATLQANFPVTMRTTPTALEQSGTATDYSLANSATTTCSAVPQFLAANTHFASFDFEVASGLTANQAISGRLIGTAAYLGWSAEL